MSQAAELSMELLQKCIVANVDKIRGAWDMTSTTHKWGITLFGGTFLFLTTRYIYTKCYRSYYKLPPGPNNLIPGITDMIGPFLYTKWNLTYASLYGPVFSMRQGSTLQIYLNDAKLCKTVTNRALDRDFPGGPGKEHYFNPISAEDNTYSFIFANGKRWSDMRSLVHSKLIRVMNTETVNKIMNSCIESELEPALKEVIDKKGALWYSRDSLTRLTFNIIYQANFGVNVGFNENELCSELAADIVELMSPKMGRRAAPLMMMPELAPKLFPNSFFQPVYDMRKRINDKIKALIEKRANQQDMSNDLHDDNKSFMDFVREESSNPNVNYTVSQEIADIIVLFIAGTDTTSQSTEWGLVLLSKQPDVQTKVRHELMTVLAKNNVDIENSKSIVFDIKLLTQLPLFRACVHEILRISCVARLGVGRKLTRDTSIKLDDGTVYNLPKDAQIHFNVEAINYNTLGRETWQNDKYGLNHEQICLENWLKDAEDSGNKKKFYQNPSFITFGVGKRDCVGKQLAMKEMRVILGYLLLNYKFSIEDKYINMPYIPCDGGRKMNAVCKPTPEIPLIVEPVHLVIN